MIGAHQRWTKAVKESPNSSLVYFSPAQQAKTVRLEKVGGELEVLDGPFTRGPEAAGGFSIITAESWDDAVEFAKESRWLPGSNEIREIVKHDGMPTWIGTKIT